MVQKMNSGTDDSSRIFSVLSHNLRRNILKSLDEGKELTFTELMNALQVDTGKLSFHIRSLQGFVEQTPNGKYKLSTLGENSTRLIKDVENWIPEVPRVDSIVQLASLKKRAFAYIIDFAITFTVFMIAGAITNVFSWLTEGVGFRLDLNIVLYMVFFWVYCTLLEGFNGQSLGKRIIRLKAIRANGEKIHYEHAAVRNFGKVFLLPFDLLFGLRMGDKRYLRYFDRFAGTTVTELVSLPTQL